jgi:hypothetical protein
MSLKTVINASISFASSEFKNHGLFLHGSEKEDE